jgi:hypothetical protein
MVIDNKSSTIRRVLRVVDCCIILHNLLNNVGDNEIPEDWRNDDDIMNEDVGQFVGE